MSIFGRLTLQTKLVLLLALSALALMVLIGAAATLMHRRMIDDRVAMVRAVVVEAKGFAQSLQDRVDIHEITQEQAVGTFREEVHRMRFGTEADYLLVQTPDGMVVMHGGDPTRQGKPTASKDANGRSTELAQNVLNSSDGGVI